MTISNNDTIETLEAPQKSVVDSDLAQILLELEKKSPYERLPKLEQQLLDYALDVSFKLYSKNPDLPLAKAVAAVLGNISNDIPPKTLLKVVQQTVEEWENWRVIDKMPVGSFAIYPP
jgi:hypothetical protein